MAAMAILGTEIHTACSVSESSLSEKAHALNCYQFTLISYHLLRNVYIPLAIIYSLVYTYHCDTHRELQWLKV